MTDPSALPNLPGFGAPTPPPGQPDVKLADRLVAALTDLDLAPTVDDDGDLTFIFQEQQMFIRSSDEDAEIVRVFGQWRLAEPVPADQAKRLQVCNDININFNMIKTAVTDETLLVTSEHMLPRGADVRSLMTVAIPLVLHAVGLWHERALGADLEKLGQQVAGAPGGAQEPPAQGPGSAFGLNGTGRP